MRILFQRTGGFAGSKIEGTLDTSTLPQPQLRRLMKLLHQSGFFELSGTLPPPGAAPDAFTFRVTVEADQGSHTLEASEGSLPTSMRPLLDFLARSIRK